MTDRLLNDQVVIQIQEAFQKLKEPVEMLYFGKKADCETCDDTLRLIQEITEISDRLSLSVYDLDADANIANQYKVDKAPGLVLAGRSPENTGINSENAGRGNGGRIVDYGVRYAGVPSGYEFSSLIQDLILVSGRESGLSQETRDFLKELRQPVLLQVFVTPT